MGEVSVERFLTLLGKEKGLRKVLSDLTEWNC